LLRLRRLDAFSERSRRTYDSTIGFGLAPRTRNFRLTGLRPSITCADSGMLTLYDGDRIT
jgi:hypothetical protein